MRISDRLWDVSPTRRARCLRSQCWAGARTSKFSMPGPGMQFRKKGNSMTNDHTAHAPRHLNGFPQQHVRAMIAARTELEKQLEAEREHGRQEARQQFLEVFDVLLGAGYDHASAVTIAIDCQKSGMSPADVRRRLA
jgi:hypothetical protein